MTNIGNAELSIVMRATIVALTGLAAVRNQRAARASVRHLLLACTFGALLILPVASTLLPAIPIETPYIDHGVLTFVALPDSALASAAAARGEHAATEPSLRQWALDNEASLVGAIWLAGALLCLAPLVAALWRLRRRRRAGVPVPGTNTLVRALSARAGVAGHVDVRQHVDAVLPMTFGYVRPLILLPVDAPQGDAENERAIAHELEHIRRRDWLTTVAARVACSLYWFHPLVWTAFRRLRLEAERACDDEVLRWSDPADYAGQLVEAADRLRGHAALDALAIAGRSDLSVRIAAVLNPRQERGRLGSPPSACIALAGMLLLMAALPEAKRAVLAPGIAPPASVPDLVLPVVPPAARRMESTPPPVQTRFTPRPANTDAIGTWVEPSGFWPAQPAPTQNPTGAGSTITGLVTDVNGAPLAKVIVDCESDALPGGSRTTITDADGVFRIDGLPSGTYDVTLNEMEYQTFKREGLIVAADTTVTVNAILKDGVGIRD
jgi:beta-lactamase regulating signal transducer with metallopeptidase domain